MARQVLPTNFKDDVLADSMGGKRRYILTENADGTFSLEDATTYTQVGDVFGAARLNAICKAVNESVDQAKVVDDIDDIKAITQSGYVPGTLPLKQVISDLTAEDGEKFRYGKTEDGQYGYIITGEDGADTVVPFRSGISLISGVGTKTITFDRNVDNVYVFSGANNVRITLNGVETSDNEYIGNSYSGLGTQLYTIGAVNKDDTLSVTQTNYGFIIVF